MDQQFRNSTGLKLVVFLVLSFTILTFLYWTSRPDNKLHLVFCDVGQGDGALIITPSGKQIIIDGGPNDSVLPCLGSHMPFYDRKIEMMILTHPQLDHMAGLIDVLKRYQVEQVLKTEAKGNIAEFDAWQKELDLEKAKISIANAGQQIKIDNNLKGSVIWPAESTFPNGQPADLNQSSIILRLEYGNFCGLFTGDIDALSEDIMAITNPQAKCTVLKIPHHGSKNSISKNLWQQLAPKIAVISNAKNNRYGHPHRETIEALNKLGTKILRTDQSGTIEIVTDGKTSRILN